MLLRVVSQAAADGDGNAGQHQGASAAVRLPVWRRYGSTSIAASLLRTLLSQYAAGILRLISRSRA